MVDVALSVTICYIIYSHAILKQGRYVEFMISLQCGRKVEHACRKLYPTPDISDSRCGLTVQVRTTRMCPERSHCTF